MVDDRAGKAADHQIVWFKRDLRVVDHAPLWHAAASGSPVLCLYVVEPDLWAQPDASVRQWSFIRESLIELRRELEAIGLSLIVRTGDVVALLDRLHRQIGIGRLLSHEETGNGWTYDRDKRVASWARAQAVPWREYSQNGVVRRLRTRDGWATRWDRTMRQPVLPAPNGTRGAHSIAAGVIPDASDFGLTADHCPGRQFGGRSVGLAALDSFLHRRGRSYHRDMSSPLTAEEACSRLSAHLAYGTLSVREVAQATWARLAEVKAMPTDVRGSWATALRAYLGRLHWHCHFMQKLESAPSIEFRNLHRAYDGMREGLFDRTRYDAWANGRTGFPFVDACMRSLAATGWINFRMRAMLVSFAAYQLWLHWRETGLHLARFFTDYEAGIHWSQVQMQSGTTGTNTVRMYNPVKQSRDQDPEGRFIRRWVPEVCQVPDAFIHEPWKMPDALQISIGCRLGDDYPLPIVDHEEAARVARERVWAVRRGDAFRSEAKAILEKHGSRKRRTDVFTTQERRRSKTTPLERTEKIFPQLALDLPGGMA
jgi:deoxyribodipyrimidine photo-lyase